MINRLAVASFLRPLRRIIPRFPSRTRRESNAWLKRHCAGVTGRVLSIGSGDDSDGLGGRYRDYFLAAAEYITSEVTTDFACDLMLDVRKMPEIGTASFDCVYCSGVLEHVDDFQAALTELHRVLRVGGVLLLGLPFRQAIHMPPCDYWRFTEYGIRTLLRGCFEILELAAINSRPRDFPAAYWVLAVKSN